MPSVWDTGDERALGAGDHEIAIAEGARILGRVQSALARCTDDMQRPDDKMAARYPRLATYLDGLPAGLASYPECKSKSSLTLTVLEGMPEPRPKPSEVPEPLSRFLKHPPLTMWILEVEARAVSLIVADHYEMTDKQYLSWLKKQNRNFFSSLMYRSVMSFLSPTAIIPKATARWAAVHRGSSLTAQFVGERDVDLILTFPTNLFSGLALQQVTAVFEGLLEHLNARNGEVVLAEITPTRGVYHARWDA